VQATGLWVQLQTAPVWEGMGLPFLLITAINVVFVVVFMTFLGHRCCPD